MKYRRCGVVAFLLLTLPVSHALAVQIDLPPTAEARRHLERAEQELLRGESEPAEREALRAINLAPDYAHAYDIYMYSLRDREPTQERFRQLAEANPQRAVYWYAHGRIAEDVVENRRALARVVELAPKSPWGYYGQAYLARTVDTDLEKAIALLETAHSLTPNEPAVASALASSLAARINANESSPDTVKWRKRAKHLIEIAGSGPSSFEAASALRVGFFLGTNDENAEYARRYVERFPAGSGAGMAYGIWLEHLMAKDPAAAAARAREALTKLDATRFASERQKIFNDVILARAEEQGREAIDALAIEMLNSPETSTAIFLTLARTYQDGRDPAIGIRLAKRGIELDAKTPEANRAQGHAPFLRVTLARILLRSGEPEQAVAALDEIKDESYRSYVAVIAGEAYMKLGQTAKAYDAYVTTVAFQPTPEFERLLGDAARALGRSEKETAAAVWAKRDASAKPATAFALDSLDGKKVSLADYRGKILLLTFWFPACGPCRAEFPYLQRIFEKYKDRGLAVVAIDVESDDAGARKFMSGQGITFPSLRGTWQLARESYRVGGAPTSFLIGPQGNVYFTHIGYRGPTGIEQIVREVEALLEHAADQPEPKK